MDSTSTLFESSYEASSSRHMRFCVICHKPFSKETSYNRHISYCRRAHTRPRSRARSCRACSIAKAKCSFQPPCLRCADKGLECVYDTVIATRKDRDEHPALSNVSVFSSASTSNVFTLDELFASGEVTGTDEGQVVIDWDAPGFTPQTPKSNLFNFNEPAWKVVLNSTFLGNLHGKHIIDDLHAKLDLETPSLTNHPWSAWITQDEHLPAHSGSIYPVERPESDFLARLPISNPVSQFSATLLMQMLRAFPQMMLRRETLPSFIHGHWYRPSSTTELSLPEPLVNCIGIAQVFATQNLESKPFLWRTIKMEQRSFIEKQEQCRLAKDDHLTAVQAQTIYIIMRVIDKSKFEQDLNLEMLNTYQFLCERFREMCNEPFCQDERQYPSSSWEDWIFAESRRRTVLVWFLIAQTVRIKTGVPCEAFDHFRLLPLSSPKSLWEARTRSAWQLEYEEYKSKHRMGLDVFGDLIDACKQSDVGFNKLKLDAWNTKTDNLGIMLSLSAAMI